ncbi:hypothetical protein QL996_13795 [Planococcus sp. APC 4015]|nr:hypothetical protein [Planococcus sp. APC 4015]
MPHTDALDEIAAELYALPPEQFTAARNARAAASDRELAAAVKALRKPTVSAWAVNLLSAGGQLADAVELSAALREAQDDLDAAELSRLSRQRRALVSALAKDAVSLAEVAGVTVSAAARDDVEKTINAAVVDPGAAAAVLSGRLVRPLEAGAFDDDSLRDAVGGSFPGAAPAPATTRDDLAERRARKAAEKAVREADRSASEAARELARVAARRDKARERLDHVRERIAEVARDLEKLTSDAESAEDELATREDEHAAASKTARAAQDEAEAARSALR